MTTIRFERDQISSKLLRGNLGEAFQRFTHELLVHDFPGLHDFQRPGKDGGIDLAEHRASSSVFIECKQIAVDGFKAAQSRWKEVAKHLEKHLAHPTQPSRGQRQYSPWYRKESPVTEYLFCVSSMLDNRDQLDRLQEEIQAFFSRLSIKHNHLRHFASLSARVLDWSDLQDYLTRYPQTLLRWFPRTRPIGLVPFDDFSEIGSFRSYLYSDVLPYYDRHTHLSIVAAPLTSSIPDEEQLLSELEGSDLAGLIITGKGGVGKTRLTLEVGRLARRKGWLVLRCRGSLSAETVIQLAEIVSKQDRVLVVADYIEIQREFNEFVESLLTLNDTYDLHLRYVANCRASYYRSLTILPRHKQLNLSPPLQEDEALWIQGFQREVVRHILQSNHIDITPEHLLICSNRPVFAVFMSYLHQSGRGEELDELLGEKDFSKWVARRLQLTFGETATSRRLAQLMTLFPLPSESLHNPELHDSIPILERLAADGWMERPSDKYKGEHKAWLVAHDVLADQIVLSYLENIPETAQLFVQHVLALSTRVGSFRSALVTMQRIADQIALGHVDWLEILVRHISHEQSLSLQRDRTVLVRTSLLQPVERIRLLGAAQEFWKGAEREADFQNAIGWLSRWARMEGHLTSDDQCRAILVDWLAMAAQFVTESNYMLSSGLRLCPDVVREASLVWISTRPLEHQTHYLIVAWLESRLPPEDIELAVWQWTTHFMYSRQLSFVASSWLEANGDPDLIRDSLFNWLEEYGNQPEAHFIYRAWLDAGGDLQVIQEHLDGWLAENATGPGAASVYVCWLRNHIPSQRLGNHVTNWLSVHGTKRQAAPVYRAWLTKGGNKEIVREAIKRWFDLWGSDSAAEPLYSAWLRADGDWESIAVYVKSWLIANSLEVKAGFIYQVWLLHAPDKNWARPFLIRWIERHCREPVAERVFTAWLYAYEEYESIVGPLTEWFGQNSSNSSADFVFKAWLRGGGSFSAIRVYVNAWFEVNWENLGVTYFITFLLSNSSSDSEAIDILLKICVDKPDSENSLWCLAKLAACPRISNNQPATLFACDTALRTFFDLKGFSSNRSLRLMTELIGALISSPYFTSEESQTQIDTLFVRWLRNLSTASVKLYSARGGQRPDYLSRVRKLVSAGVLMPDEDRVVLKSALRWMNGWSAKIKPLLREDLDFLSTNFPTLRLWDTVKFERAEQSQEPRSEVSGVKSSEEQLSDIYDQGLES